MLKAITASLALVAITGSLVSASADSGFYEGENLTYIVATSAGGGYDAYARHIGTYLQKYLPVDNVVIRNVPGAGHIVGASTLWRARPDGLTIGTFNAGLIYGQLLGNEAIRMDLRDFEWIGKAAGEARAIVVSKDCAIQSADELLAAKEPVKFGSAGVGSASHSDMMLLADALDLNIDVIPGFDGTEGEMSMLRGEICAVLGSTSSFQNFVNAGNGSYILVIGDDLEGVPNAMEYAHTDRAKRLISFIDALSQLGRVTAAPPGTPGEQVAALRAAYDETLQDPKFLAEARQLGQPIEPASGEAVKALVAEALDQTPETIALITQAINGGSKQ
jgi:tripartite-type tricarboxylate transporter receptor subunit TctC